MLLMVVTWIILLFRPRFVFLFALGAATMLFSLPAFLAAQSREEIIVLLLGLWASWAILFLVGGLIIVVRKWMISRTSSAEKAADRELERIRSEAAAREGAPPAA